MNTRALQDCLASTEQSRASPGEEAVTRQRCQAGERPPSLSWHRHLLQMPGWSWCQQLPRLSRAGATGRGARRSALPPRDTPLIRRNVCVCFLFLEGKQLSLQNSSRDPGCRLAVRSPGKSGLHGVPSPPSHGTPQTLKCPRPYPLLCLHAREGCEGDSFYVYHQDFRAKRPRSFLPSDLGQIQPCLSTKL